MGGPLAWCHGYPGEANRCRTGQDLSWMVLWVGFSSKKHQSWFSILPSTAMGLLSDSRQQYKQTIKRSETSPTVSSICFDTMRKVELRWTGCFYFSGNKPRESKTYTPKGMDHLSEQHCEWTTWRAPCHCVRPWAGLIQLVV